MEKGLLIKVCGITDLANREMLESLPIALLGFIFYPPSPRYAGKATLSELRALTGTSKKKAGVFVDTPPDEIEAYLESLSLTHVQLHGNESPDLCARLKKQGVMVIKAFRVNQGFDFGETRAYEAHADYFLFDTKAEQPGGTGQKFDWTILNDYSGATPFFLSGGIKPSDAMAIRNLRHPALFGLDINSGFEDRPGIKNILMLREFLNNLGISE